MHNWLIAVAIGIVLGALIGIRTAHSSNARQPVEGGLPAQVFHYFACAGFSSTVPFVIAGLVVGLSFWALFGTAVGFLALTAIFLLIYAGFERSRSRRNRTFAR